VAFAAGGSLAVLAAMLVFHSNFLLNVFSAKVLA
jgi:hypothetical protein